MTPIPGPWPVRADELAALGAALRGAHALELAADAVLARCLGVDIAVAGNLRGQTGLGAALRMTRALVGESDCGVPADELTAWLDLAEGARQARNRVVHGLLLDDEQGHIRKMAVPGYGITDRSVADISSDGNLMTSVAQRGIELADLALPSPVADDPE